MAVTEDDLEFNPKVEPFGKCKLKPSSGGYLPCAFAPAGKWLKTYDKVKIMEKSCLTEISELMCITGGKITILKHGQQAELGKRNVGKANTQEQQILNPIIDFDQYREEIEKIDEPVFHRAFLEKNTDFIFNISHSNSTSFTFYQVHESSLPQSLTYDFPFPGKVPSSI